MLKYKVLLVYLAKFLGLFCLLFYGTEAIIGLSSKENSYSPFVASYLDFVTPFRELLLKLSKVLLSLFGYSSFLVDSFTLRLSDGSGVRMVYSCIGYGVLSFWAAFVFANKGTWKKKAVWIAGGCLALCAINVARVSLLLLATSKSWPIPLGWDHHTWFNILSYGLIFTMIWLYDRSGRRAAGERTRSEDREERRRDKEYRIVGPAEKQTQKQEID